MLTIGKYIKNNQLSETAYAGEFLQFFASKLQNENKPKKTIKTGKDAGAQNLYVFVAKQLVRVKE